MGGVVVATAVGVTGNELEGLVVKNGFPPPPMPPMLLLKVVSDADVVPVLVIGG